MSFDFLTEHQIHILLRILTVGAMFLLLMASVAFLSRRNAARQKALKEKERGGAVEILTKDGWRRKAKRKKGRR